ncbi:hypothetical protein NE237_009359 [Protea cynaroides]|uniref:Uncharacterized protein n=1 Tax=Protea cynaroides TaxID=273540 RepID=A0A9Q0KYE8_9MAGN|nr:hypothetical protein NE237_009359 [Protea cynaroides]
MSSSSSSSSRFRKRTIKSVIVMISIVEVYQALMNGDSKSLEPMKELSRCTAIRKCNGNPKAIFNKDISTYTWTAILRERWTSFLTKDDLVGVLVATVMSIIGLVALLASTVWPRVVAASAHASLPSLPKKKHQVIPLNNIMQLEGFVHHNSSASIRGREGSFQGGISLSH